MKKSIKKFTSLFCAILVLFMIFASCDKKDDGGVKVLEFGYEDDPNISYDGPVSYEVCIGMKINEKEDTKQDKIPITVAYGVKDYVYKNYMPTDVLNDTKIKISLFNRNEELYVFKEQTYSEFIYEMNTCSTKFSNDKKMQRYTFSNEETMYIPTECLLSFKDMNNDEKNRCFEIRTVILNNEEDITSGEGEFAWSLRGDSETVYFVFDEDGISFGNRELYIDRTYFDRESIFDK